MWTYTVGFFLNHLGGRCRTESSNRCTSSPYNTSVVCCLRSPTVSQYRPNIPAQLAPGTAKRSKLNSLSKQGFFFSTDTTHPLPACYTPFHETKGSSQPKPNQSFVSSPPLVSSIFFFYFHFFIGLYLHPPKPP